VGISEKGFKVTREKSRLRNDGHGNLVNSIASESLQQKLDEYLLY